MIMDKMLLESSIKEAIRFMQMGCFDLSEHKLLETIQLIYETEPKIEVVYYNPNYIEDMVGRSGKTKEEIHRMIVCESHNDLGIKYEEEYAYEDYFFDNVISHIKDYEETNSYYLKLFCHAVNENPETLKKLVNMERKYLR